jgi:16S rRNA (guanine527-N7)-methyltransferase
MRGEPLWGVTAVYASGLQDGPLTSERLGFLAMPDDVTQGQSAQLRAFAERVRVSPHNLVSRRARDELDTRHVPEAVALAHLLPAGPHRLLDVGSGGGFPGIVIAIVRPDLEVHLLESTRKKVDFLEEVSTALGLDVTVHHGRAEELARQGELAGRFDLVTARAVAALEDLIGLTLPFLAPDGVLYAVKGERWATELAAAGQALRRAGGAVLATPDDLPAPVGEAEQRPRVVMIGRSQ